MTCLVSIVGLEKSNLNLHTHTAPSKFERYGFILVMIVGIGGFAVAAAGIAAHFHVGLLSNLSQVDAMIMMSAGIGSGVICLIVGIVWCVKNHRAARHLLPNEHRSSSQLHIESSSEAEQVKPTTIQVQTESVQKSAQNTHDIERSQARIFSKNSEPNIGFASSSQQVYTPVIMPDAVKPTTTQVHTESLQKSAQNTNDIERSQAPLFSKNSEPSTAIVVPSQYVYTPIIVPNEILIMSLTCMNHRQRNAIARVNTMTHVLVGIAEWKNRPKLLEKNRKEIVEKLTTGHNLGSIQVLFNLIDCMNSWKFANDRPSNKYILFPCNPDADAKELAEQLLNYIEDHSLIPLLLRAGLVMEWSPLKELEWFKIGNYRAICEDDFSEEASLGRNNYPNKSHLKKIINPEYKYDIVYNLKFIEAIVEAMDKINGSPCGIQFKEESMVTYHSLAVRRLLNDIEEKELIPLFFQAIGTLFSHPRIWFRHPPRQIEELKGFDLSFFCIDNPDYYTLLS